MAERVGASIEETVKASSYASKSKMAMRDTIAAYILSLYEKSIETGEVFTFSDPCDSRKVEINNEASVSGIEWYLDKLMSTRLKLDNVRKFYEDIKKYRIVTPEMVDEKLNLLNRIRARKGAKKVSRIRIAKCFVNPDLLEEPKIK